MLAPRKKYLGASWLLEFLPNFEPCNDKFPCDRIKIKARVSLSTQKSAVNYSSFDTEVEASMESLKCIGLCSESFM